MDELLRSLPNGLHDAEPTAIAVDSARAEVIASVDAGTGQPETDPRPDLGAPDGGFLCWLFLSSLNGFVRIGARDVRLEWK